MIIAIELPDYVYEHAKEHTEDSRDEGIAMDAIREGTLIPERKKADSEIEVGDEVYLLDSNAPRVVTAIYDYCGNKQAVQITASGKWATNDICDLRKTGRRFQQIAEVLKQMKEGNE